MKIQWYPGHMRKASRQIEEILPQVDLVLEMLDARLPASSRNPLLGELCGDKPRILALNKADLADPAATQRWIEHFQQQSDLTAIGLRASGAGADAAELIGLCRHRLPGRADQPGGIRLLVAGVPNVGKSSLVNLLAGRAIARTGNEAAITRQQQHIDLGNGIVLLDTPGLLWPDLENPCGGYRLAASGAIGEGAMDYLETARFVLAYLAQNYPAALRLRYQIDVSSEAGPEAELMLEEIGRLRGWLRAGGVVDQERTARALLTDLRAGALGEITLELPEMLAAEHQAVLEARARKAEAKAVRKAVRRKK